MDWEIILGIASSTIGIIQYLKGIFKDAKTPVWVILQPVLCIILAFIWIKMPSWVFLGILGFALSQLGYETIVQAIKRRIDK